jgi:hypothetical protein
VPADVRSEIEIDRPRAEVTAYAWEDTAGGGTRMTLRNRGEPAGFSRVAAPMMMSAIRRANHKDLERLKSILEDARAGR